MAVPFQCSQIAFQIANTPSTLYSLDIVTGTLNVIGNILPTGDYNAVGFNVIDNYIYGWSLTATSVVRISSDATAEILPAVPNLPTAENYIVGDVDLNGYLYLYAANTTRFYVIDVNPSRGTYLQLVDPANNFQLQTSNFGVAITAQQIADWAFNPINNQLYSVTSAGNVITINPITGAVTPLTSSGLLANPHGALWYDIQGNLYAINNVTGNVYKITTTATTATGSIFSIAMASSNNDGARCPLARLDLMSTLKSVDLTQAVLGDTLTYTIVITNNSTTTPTTNVIFTDPIPNGTTYVVGSATVDGSPAVGIPATGITIGTIPTGESRTVQYQVDISNTTLPYPNPIPNTSTVTYSEGLPINSNTVFTRVIFSERGINFI